MYFFQLNAYIAVISITILVCIMIIIAVLKVMEKVEEYNEQRSLQRKEFQGTMNIWFKGVAIFTYVHLLTYLTLTKLFPEWINFKVF